MVEVVVVRHPDDGTDVSVFVDGVLSGAEVWVVDPGAGYELHDWLAARRAAVSGASEAAGRQLADAHDSYASSEFVSAENTCTLEHPVTGAVCGVSLNDGEGYDGLCGEHADRAEAMEGVLE